MQYVRTSYCIDNLFIIYIFRKRNSILNITTREAGAYDFCGMSRNVISLIFRDSDMDSENIT